MPVTRRSATIAAAPAAVWQTVADPHQLARWWPRVERVEGVSGSGFTEVLRSDRGALVRADFRIGQRNKPRLVVWSQDLEGTPFAKLLRHAETTVMLEPNGEDATRVELRLEQRLQGLVAAPSDLASYNEMLVTREPGSTPKQPTTIILKGSLGG